MGLGSAAAVVGGPRPRARPAGRAAATALAAAGDGARARRSRRACTGAHLVHGGHTGLEVRAPHVASMGQGDGPVAGSAGVPQVLVDRAAYAPSLTSIPARLEGDVLLVLRHGISRGCGRRLGRRASSPERCKVYASNVLTSRNPCKMRVSARICAAASTAVPGCPPLDPRHRAGRPHNRTTRGKCSELAAAEHRAPSGSRNLRAACRLVTGRAREHGRRTSAGRRDRGRRLRRSLAPDRSVGK